MESMDREQAFAILGLPEGASREDIEAQCAARRRQLQHQLSRAYSAHQKRLLERALSELERARTLAMVDPRHPSAGLPGGAAIHIQPEARLADRYVVKERLGYGERGAVFRALDLTWGKDVALKVLLRETLLVPGTVLRLAAQVRTTYGFAHSGIANTYDVIADGPHTFIVSELLDADTMRQHLRKSDESRGKGRGLPRAALVQIAGSIATALEYAGETTLHLNLKPENVFITRDGTVKLTDFALDGVVSPILRGRTRAALEQRLFRAPECVRLTGNEMMAVESIDSRADQFSLAALVYFLATGEPPPAEGLDLGRRRPDLPPSFTLAVARALSPSPEARFASTQHFVSALRMVTFRRRGWIMGGAMAATFALTAAAAVLVPDIRVRLAQVPALVWLPGLNGEALAQRQTLALQERTSMLRERLAAAQKDLNLRLVDTRLDVRAKDTQAAGEARKTLAMLEALSALVTPQVFNSPDVLNAYNLSSVAAELLNARKYAEAESLLSAAEMTLAEKLKDLHQAELVVQQQYGVALPATDNVSPQALRDSWEQTTAARRRFAAEVDQGMVAIPAGRFVMGDIAGNGTRAELPLREVKVSPFKLGRTEVTRGAYVLCVADGACAPPSYGAVNDPGESELPVAGVNWADAQAYVSWLRAKTGEAYRLPTEAEWEYAARAGTAASYPWGDSVANNRANCMNCGSPWDATGPAPVASFAANAFGLHDMNGNLWEWTADCWYRDYSTAPATSAARDGDVSCSRRALRGGSWDNDAWMARSAYRSMAPAAARQDLNGFRIAKTLE